MNRLAVGALLGGIAVYLYDPELGDLRRGRLSSIWQKNRVSALQAGRAASETIDSAKPLARRMTKAIAGRDWAQIFDRGRSRARLSGLLGAAAAGGIVVYFMDPVKGSDRRLSVLAAGRWAFGQMANAVKPLPGGVGDHIADAFEAVPSQVS